MDEEPVRLGVVSLGNAVAALVRAREEVRRLQAENAALRVRLDRDA